jgi:sugar phosphate isomerase/epimerase
MVPTPFRLGATSYIIPADIPANVRYLAGKVQDVELVLFDQDGGPSNLPTPVEIAELASLAAEHALTYTVHLPLDLHLDDSGGSQHISLDKARRVIDCTRDLAPWAYVAHLDGRSVLPPGTSPQAIRDWQTDSIRALDLVGQWAGGLQNVALENLEGYPLDFHAEILERSAVSRAVDIGHLWLDGHDALAPLRAALPRTRVIHLHGLLAGKDHHSLANVPPAELKAVFAELTRVHYSGVLTLEIFSEEDFLTSMDAIAAVMV